MDIISGEVSACLTDKLLYEMKNGMFADTDRLPPEVELAKYLGISRTLVRDCLSILEREGFINRKHGVGTIINRPVLETVTRLDLEKEFLDMISSAGYEAKTAWNHHELIAADETVAQKLRIEAGDMVYQIRRIITADGRPAIYCEDYVSARLVKNDITDSKYLEQTIFDFLENECQVYMTMDLTEILAVLADQQLGGYLNVEVGSPLLYMDEIGYDFYGKPVFYSKEYYVNGILHHKVVRKKWENHHV